MVKRNDPFWNDVEDMNDGSMKCKFCEHLFAKDTSISRIKWHLSGETGHGVGICCGQVPKEVQEAAFLAMHRGNKRHKSIPSSSNVNDYAIPTCPQEQDNAGDAGRMQVGVQGMENTGEGSFQHVDRSVSPSRLGVDAHENRGEAAQGTDVVNQLAGGTWAQIFSEAQKLNEINLMLEKEIESTDEEAVKMISLGGKFERVSYLPARRGIGDRSVKDYEAFESRRHVLDEILEALKDNDVNLVGVYGMPGVGKTTIVKKVAAQVKANRIFDVVVLAVVSKTPDLRKIQGQIADGLGFELKAETDSGRAERLRERLERETKVLVILDDIWERLELDDVGIPSGSDNRGCKILMTSRDRNALYCGMDTKKLFHLKVLLENEAWNLFKNMAGDDIENPDLKPVAEEVAKRCAGLPILLVTVASALKGGDVSEWKDALERLKRFDKDGIHSPVNSALELSYTFLKGAEIKSVFLLCGQLQPHGSTILDLLKYTVGLGLFKHISTLEEARHRLNKLVNDLISSCLLEGGADGNVKMHDVVHCFAMSVAYKDHRVLGE